jgi:hypothetical protein
MKTKEEVTEIEINGVKFEKKDLVDPIWNPDNLPYPYPYRSDYIQAASDIQDGKVNALETYRSIILTDLWFIVNFVLKIPGADRPFVIKACQEVESGPDGWCIDLWARYHYKSTIKTIARNIQRILRNPEVCIMIASHTRPAAKKFMKSIMLEFEQNEFLKACFPDVLWQKPRNESPTWSEDNGIIVKRKSIGRKESTVEAHGIKEGMPTGTHFEYIDLDDLETIGDVKNPDVIQKGRTAVDLCNFLKTEHGVIDITGTPYSHIAIYYPYIIGKKRADGSAKFMFRRKPVTHDGTKDGVPIMITAEELADIHVDMAQDGYGEYSFNCQMLIDPTPKGSQALDSTKLRRIDFKDIPQNLVKFMVIDPAGDDDENATKGDDWGVWIVGVEPKANELGIRRRYILDGYLDVISESAAPELLGRMFMNNGPIRQVGYEYKSVTPAWLQNFCEYVRKAGGMLHADPKMKMVLRLKDGGRQKGRRIISAISRPLNYGAYHISNEVIDIYDKKLRDEMDKLGFWTDNGVDALAYVDDIIPQYDFSIHEERIKSDSWKDDEANNEYDNQ